jgi:hypothetical protein
MVFGLRSHRGFRVVFLDGAAFTAVAGPFATDSAASWFRAVAIHAQPERCVCRAPRSRYRSRQEGTSKWLT